MTKKCSRCHKTKSLSGFYKQKTTSDGCGSYCKSCAKAYNQNWLIINRKLNRATLTKGDSKRKAKHRALHRDRQVCRQRVTWAIKSGSLKRKPCEVCGSLKNIHAHHEDYSKWKEVNWLCAKHHRKLHAGKSRENESPRRGANLTSHVNQVPRLGGDNTQ